MNKNIVNLIPREIIYQWIKKTNSEVCKLWYEIWCTKPMSVDLTNKSSKYVTEDISCSLSVLSKFKNLVALDLGKNSIIDESIESLVTLQVLNLDCNKFVTDKMLLNLTNLTTLSLMHNEQITNKSLKYLTNIVDLYIDQNTKITLLMPNITKLDISDNELITDNLLKHLTRINHLTLCSSDSISDMSIRCLTNITYLNIYFFSDHVTDRSIQKLTNLTHLNIGYCNKITDNSIKHLTNITRLSLEFTDNITYESIKYLTNLTSIELFCHDMEDDELEKLTNLKSLFLDGQACHISGKSIRKLTKLESLTIRQNFDVMTEDIYELTNLTKLGLFICDGIDHNKLLQKFPHIDINIDK
jgi:hypothetical protein